ncbi:MAG: response regulator [Elusimicrobia bacterium]|nr:response regulator [Elusimicrobiota bacterium]
MSDPIGTNWKFLIVEDNETVVKELLEALPGFVDPPDTIESEVFDAFADAKDRLKEARFDVLILDLKDDSDKGLEAASNPVGLEVFEALKSTRFAPVIFYTALAHKVRSQETSFVRVVEKTEGIEKVKKEVRQVLQTQLPYLARKIEDIQRAYMWDFVGTNWKEFKSAHEQADLAYLLARRLTVSLEGEARKLARKLAGKDVPLADPAKVHPMQLYVVPPVDGCRLAGGILQGDIGGETAFWLVLTPSCDFEQEGRLLHVLLAHCLPLAKEPEFLSWQQNPVTNAGPLKSLIGDHREKCQPERFKFLPGTYFLPDLVVDFQQLKAVTPEQFEKLKPIASLDSPYAEAALSRFARYFGRLGTLDIDKVVVLSRLQEGAKPAATAQDDPPSSAK